MSSVSLVQIGQDILKGAVRDALAEDVDVFLEELRGRYRQTLAAAGAQAAAHMTEHLRTRFPFMFHDLEVVASASAAEVKEKEEEEVASPPPPPPPPAVTGGTALELPENPQIAATLAAHTVSESTGSLSKWLSPVLKDVTQRVVNSSEMDAVLRARLDEFAAKITEGFDVLPLTDAFLRDTLQASFGQLMATTRAATRGERLVVASSSPPAPQMAVSGGGGGFDAASMLVRRRRTHRRHRRHHRSFLPSPSPGSLFQ